ncbi:hypothetical protein ATE92_2235 [Ulvibacter sp. MAR_2010_11]|uniref:hypothetical protein n=1 Tax=Ulvibacter sp. MAR_2010_11 TaxID=1250229 RepID=UPI000C2B63E0|nr:hypothetical protein [Ulvibacter sp. MAR_2010_11]PKA84065.1 hypothetical protein ATE92_2235 [Ulvibacter sp. MAR_2010_11]
MKNPKYKLLRKGILYDAIGMATMFIPVVGPFLDIIWAPYAAKKMSDMYKGTEGKIASVLVFIEELLPISDFIPTFTLMWIYTYVFAAQPQPEPQTIEVKVND